MKIKDQVISLELAKRMKELGFEQESLFYHAQQYYLDAWIISRKKRNFC